jgi:aryl-alcohol dehydrogenase-like predicted oxidoreductase
MLVIGATSVAQLKENIAAFDKQDRISPEVLTAISGVYKRFRDPSKV